MVEFNLDNSSSLDFLPFFGGKNPAKKKLSVGRPEDVKAVRKADGPGIELTVISFSMALLINR